MCNVHGAWMKILILWYAHEQWTLEWNIKLNFESNLWILSVKHQRNLPSISANCFLHIWSLRSVTEYIGNASPYWSLNILTQCFFFLCELYYHTYICIYSYPTSFSVYKYVNQFRMTISDLWFSTADIIGCAKFEQYYIQWQFHCRFWHSLG